MLNGEPEADRASVSLRFVFFGYIQHLGYHVVERVSRSFSPIKARPRFLRDAYGHCVCHGHSGFVEECINKLLPTHNVEG